MNVEMRPIDSIRPYENNPRQNDAAVDAVVASGRAMAAHLLEAAAADVEYRDGAFRVVGTDRSIGLFGVARAAA